jgi:hypothetical protein
MMIEVPFLFSFFLFRSFLVIDLNVRGIFICLERFHELEKRCREFENANNELKQLNTQLEKDLLSVGGVTELFRRGPEVCLIISLTLFPFLCSYLGTNK